MAAPLDGIRVLDMTIFQQGPVATMILGDLGAEVIKIEEPVRGDPGRGAFRLQDSPVARKVLGNYYFEAFNRNKKGLMLNLKSERGREVLYRLVEQSDVFVQNLRPGVPERLGVDFASLRKHNPRLVYASGSGFGPKGPDARRPCYDSLAQARSGIMSSIGEPGFPPTYLQNIVDQSSGLTLAFGIVAALYARDQTGVGQVVDTSLLGTGLFLQGAAIHDYLRSGEVVPRSSRRQRPAENVYCCGDGKWLALSLSLCDEPWPRLCQILGKTDWQDDPRFSSEPWRDHGQELCAFLDEVFAARPRAEWLRLLEAASLPCSPVQDYGEVASDRQVVENRDISDYDSPTGGTVKVVRVPLQFGIMPATEPIPAPELGQHTEEVLLEVGGYTWEEIEALREQGVY